MNNYYGQVSHPDCPNCKKKNSAFMGSSEWGHSHLCCSRACGIRLGKRIKSGMVNLENGYREVNHVR